MTGSGLLRLGLLIFTATSFVVLGDTAGKLMTQSGISPFFVAFTRFALAALCLLPFSGLTRDELPTLLHWRILLRAALIVGGICSILTALKTEPIANVFGGFYIGPVVSYGLAILFLGERTSPLRTLFLLIGFAGVMLVVKPGFGATAGMGFALLAGCFYGAYLTTTRAVAGAYRPRFLLISQLVIGSVLLTPAGLSASLPTVDPTLVALIILSAGGSAVGNFLLVQANRKADASLIAPLIYTQLISATLLGVLVFGDWPDAVSLLGLIVIACSGFGSLLVPRRL
ncbi:MAG: hypothetical protein CSA70_08850 [Rhodobacterales bacterium]|nr:MAG: hypothetical protein CSA70_08850 [Rhodobacterales bacterium]